MAQAADIARGVVARAFDSPPRVGVCDWVERHCPLPPSGMAAAQTGPFRFDRVPYLRGIARAWVDDAVREMVVLKSAQLGYTELITRLLLYEGVVRKRSSLIYQPDQSLSQWFSASKMRPTVEASDAATGATSGSPRDKKASLFTFHSAMIELLWANSPTSGSARTVPVVVADEYPKFPLNFDELARSRCSTFPNSLYVKGGTPMDASTDGHTGIDTDYAASDARRFMVPCPHTGRFFELYSFKLLRWEGSTRADPEHLAAGHAWIDSPFCPEGANERDFRIYEHHKEAMVRHGVWCREGERVEPAEGMSWEDVREYVGDPTSPSLSAIDEAGLRELPDRSRLRWVEGEEEKASRAHARGSDQRPPIRIVGAPLRPGARAGFRLSGLVNLIGRPWGVIAAAFVRTEGRDPQFWRDVMGEPWQGTGDHVASVDALCTPVADGGFRMGEAPAGVAAAMLVIDVQKDCLYTGLLGFSADLADRYLILPERVPRREEARLLDVQEHLAGTMLRYQNGRETPVNLIGIDHGHWSADVESLERRLRTMGKTVQMLKGDGTTDRSWSVKEGKTQYGGRLLNLNTSVLKDRLHLLLTPGGPLGGNRYDPNRPGCYHLPEDLPDWVRDHLTAEYRMSETLAGKTLKSRGLPVTRWTLRPGRRRNDFWDILYNGEGLLEWMRESLLVRLGTGHQPSGTGEEEDKTGPVEDKAGPVAHARGSMKTDIATPAPTTRSPGLRTHRTEPGVSAALERAREAAKRRGLG